VTTRDEALHLKLKLAHMRLGLGVGMNDVETVLRALPGLPLRYAAHDRAARALAKWSQGRAEFTQVLHPALADSPGHAAWKALCGDEDGQAAGLFSVIFKPDITQTQVDAFCDALKLFKLGYSWGGPISLVVPYVLSDMRAQATPHLKPGILVRFSVGLEAVGDLQEDLAQALQKL
jgi:cystathionine beta-lyase